MSRHLAHDTVSLGEEAPNKGDTFPRPGDLLKEALENFRQGKLAKSADLCREYLAIHPHAPEFLALQGLILQALGRFRMSIQSLRAALLFGQNLHWIHYAIGVSLHALHKKGEALAHFREASALYPQSAQYLLKFGSALQEAQRYEEAQPILQKALDLKPDQSVIQYRLGIGSRHLGRPAEALRHFTRATSLEPRFKEAWLQLGSIQCETGCFDSGMESYRRAMEIDPADSEVWFRQALALYKRGIPESAVDHVQQALRLNPGYVEAHVLRGELFAVQGLMSQAAKCFDNGLRMCPDDPHCLLSQALMLEHRGKDEAAREIVAGLDRQLANDCRLLSLQARLARDLQERKDILRRIGKRLEHEASLSVHARAQLHFTAAHLCDREGEYGRAFKHFIEGNRSQRAARPFNRTAAETKFAEIREVFSAQFLAKAPKIPDAKRRMIFIVGMPRSGTSLAEQILAGHSRVYAAGELPHIERILCPGSLEKDPSAMGRYPQNALNMRPEGFQELTTRYLNSLPAQSMHFDNVTDKMPHNFVHLGMISLLFPNARLVHCVRDPLDTMLSCFFQDFAEGNSYCFDMCDCAWFYQRYREQMAYWEQTLRTPIFELTYERLVTDPENTIQALLDFCGINWEPACLNFHHNRREVYTSSYKQVRKPFYRSSIARWKRYAEYIWPLVDALGPFAEHARGQVPPPKASNDLTKGDLGGSGAPVVAETGII